MTILVDATLDCNLKCKYCYNQFLRDRFRDEITNVKAIKDAIKRVYNLGLGKQAVLHGGEPLLLSKDQLDELLGYICSLTGNSNVQTNGTLIDNEIIKIFKRNNTSVGVSIDGPGELNRFRMSQKLTSRVIDNIFWLKEEGIRVGVIMVLHRANGLPEHRKQLKDFIYRLSEAGITGRLNLCLFPFKPGIELSPLEARDLYLDLGLFMEENGINGWSPFSDMIHALTGKRQVMCTFNFCDPYATGGGVVITPSGQVSVCHKFHEERLAYTPPQLKTRAYILSQTDCKGCKYFQYCGGGCPANALNQDWRNKTKWCPVWKSLWSFIENRLRFLEVSIASRNLPFDYQGGGNDHGDHWEVINT